MVQRPSISSDSPRMVRRRKIIIDTDPGVDDILALLLALASPELDVLAITTVHGNIDLFNTTRNTITLLNVLQAAAQQGETSWAQELFQSEKKTILAAGAKTPLLPEKQLDAAYFHGKDGLGGVSETYPEYLPSAKDWYKSFPSLTTEHNHLEPGQYNKTQFPGLWASSLPAHLEMLKILEQEPSDTVSIVALGPMTNLSLACLADYKAFSRVQEVVVMGGALTVPGNVTPKGEFNFLADPEAAAHVFSYSSPAPSSTFPKSPDFVERRLNITLLPLDTTTTINLSLKTWTEYGGGDGKQGCLKTWCNVFMNRTFETMRGLYLDSSIEKLKLSMHDPACIWYLLTALPHPSLEDTDSSKSNGWTVRREVDVRIECTGTWTRGACVIDERGRQRVSEALEDVDQISAGSDTGTWLDPRQGNRIAWATASPGSRAFADIFMSSVFGR